MLFSDVKFKWKDVLDALEWVFDEHPLLEMAVASTYIDATRRTTKEDARFSRDPKGHKKVMSSIYPYYHVARCVVDKFLPFPIIPSKEPECKYGVFVIGSPRDNDFGCIYPVLKMYDEMGLGSILFTDSVVMKKKKDLLNELKHCEIVFYDKMQYTLSPTSVRQMRYDDDILNTMLLMCRSDEIRRFLIDNLSKIDFEIKKILIKTHFITKHLRHRSCKFLFSIGHYPYSLAAEQLGIRTYVTSHGFIVSNERTVFYSPHNLDEVISWGPMSEDKIREICGDKKITSLGNPGYDKMIEDYKKILPENRNHIVITYFSHSHVPDAREKYTSAARGILRIKTEFPEIEIVIKLHPYENDEIYRECFGDRYNEFTIIKDQSGMTLPAIFKRTDIAMSIDSTTLLEAMMLDIPGIQLGLSEHGVLSDYHLHGATLLVESEEELVEVIRNFLDTKQMGNELSRKEFLEGQLTNLGNATKHILDHMMGSRDGHF